MSKTYFASGLGPLWQFGWCAGLATIVAIAGASAERVTWVLAAAMTAQLIGRLALVGLRRLTARLTVRALINDIQKGREVL